ncbi:putative glutathione synthase [Helianthus annuus]|nr:putative glutathione synthase [Helianthus annuus]
MGAACSSSPLPLSLPNHHSSTLHHPKSPPNFIISPSNLTYYSHFPKSSMNSPPKCSSITTNSSTNSLKNPISDPHSIDSELVQKLVHDALVWSSLHGLVVGDRNVERSGLVPGVGMVHAPIALLPNSFPEAQWNQACELAPVFNELVDRVSLDGKFLQDTLSRTKKVDAFTSRLLDIHSRMLQSGKKEDIRLGLHRSDYMLDEKTNLLLQIELNTISCSFSGLSCLVSELHRSLLSHYTKPLGLDSQKVPINTSASKFAEVLAKAWSEFSNPSIRKTLAEIDAQGKILADGTLQVDGETVAVIYFRAGYAPTDYPSESEWKARLLMEESSAIKCPSISYHLTGTKKVQQELAKPNVLERFLENKDGIVKLRGCFAGLWSLDDSDAVKNAIQHPEAYVMKPQREGGGHTSYILQLYYISISSSSFPIFFQTYNNVCLYFYIIFFNSGNNIYGDDVKETLLRLQKEGSEEEAAYILMQRIFPAVFPTLLVREGICYKEHAISELGIFSAYLRNKETVISNEQCGYLMRTKVSSSNEGGVAAGFAVLDSLYLS